MVFMRSGFSQSHDNLKQRLQSSAKGLLKRQIEARCITQSPVIITNSQTHNTLAPNKKISKSEGLRELLLLHLIAAPERPPVLALNAPDFVAETALLDHNSHPRRHCHDQGPHHAHEQQPAPVSHTPAVTHAESHMQAYHGAVQVLDERGLEILDADGVGHHEETGESEGEVAGDGRLRGPELGGVDVGQVEVQRQVHQAVEGDQQGLVDQLGAQDQQQQVLAGVLLLAVEFPQQAHLVHGSLNMDGNKLWAYQHNHKVIEGAVIGTRRRGLFWCRCSWQFRRCWCPRLPSSGTFRRRRLMQ